jgi:hypothetical protein
MLHQSVRFVDLAVARRRSGRGIGRKLMKRTSILAILPLGLTCLLAMCCPGSTALAGFREERDPYEICRDRGLSTVEFNRCISDVYIEELGKAETVVELEQALRGRGSAGGSTQLRQSTCLFNPTTGRYQECHLMSAGDQCLQYAGPCVP